MFQIDESPVSVTQSRQMDDNGTQTIFKIKIDEHAPSACQSLLISVSVLMGGRQGECHWAAPMGPAPARE